MTTYYNTPRGVIHDPMPVEVWRFDGTGPLGRLETSERIEVTFAERGAGTAVIDTPLTELSGQLLDGKGETLVVARFNGQRHISSIVEAEIYADEGDGDDVRVKATTASAWSMLDGQVIPPVPDRPLSQQGAVEEYVLTGPVETVVKTLVSLGAARLGHPIKVMPDAGQGPTVTVRSTFDTVADLVSEALLSSGYRLTLDAWLPGDEKVGDFSLTAPSIIADVIPYRDNPGLQLSADGHDLESWSMKYARPTATSVIVAADTDDEDIPKSYTGPWSTAGAYSSTWAQRETYITVSQDETPADAAARELRDSKEKTTLDATAVPALSWEFGSDGGYDRQYLNGDRCDVTLPGVGTIAEVVSEVTVVLTPTSLTVTPKVGSSDTADRDLYSLVASVSKRVDRVQKRGR